MANSDCADFVSFSCRQQLLTTTIYFSYSHGKVNYGQVKVERTTFPPQQPRSQISNRHQSTIDEHDERTRFASRQQPEHSNYGRGQIENRYQSPVTERTKFVLQEPEYPNYARDEIQSRHQSPIIIYSEPTTSAPRGFTINQDYYDFPRNANTNRYQSPINRRYEQTQSAPSRNEIENRYQSSIERSTVSPRAFSVSQQSEYSDLPIISINNRHQSPTNRNDDDRINYYSNR